MLPAFLRRPRELLSSDGRFHAVASGAGFRKPLVLISRELCSFGLFDPGPAGGAAALAAARLHARSAAPFVNAGWIAYRSGKAIAIWWWDLDVIGLHLRSRFKGGPARLLPEPLAQPRGQGWRIVRTTPGFEAQYWDADGALRGSIWRQEAFDTAAWRAFSRGLRAGADGVAPAPADPPAAQTLPLTASAPRGARVDAVDPQATVRLVVAAVLVALVAAAGLFLGQGWRMNRLATEAEVQVAALPKQAAALPADSALAAFRKASAGRDPAEALSVALGVLGLYRVEPTGYDIDRTGMTLRLPYTAIDRVDRIVAELEGSGMFSDARPMTDESAQTISLQLTVAPETTLSSRE